jgi:hypothetical protein
MAWYYSRGAWREGLLYGRRVRSRGEITQPGDYFGPASGWTGGLSCFFLKPNARNVVVLIPRQRSIQHVDFPPHTYRECDDGSLEIRASIGDTARGSTDSDGWHGFLNEGHAWQQV